MSRENLKERLVKKPFEPFRIVQTDGAAYDIYLPDLLWVGVRQAHVGMPRRHKPTFFNRYVSLDLLHIIRVEPLEFPTTPTGQNGSGAA